MFEFIEKAVAFVAAAVVVSSYASHLGKLKLSLSDSERGRELEGLFPARRAHSQKEGGAVPPVHKLEVCGMDKKEKTRVSPAFAAYLDFSKKVFEASPVREDGKREYFFYSKLFKDTGARHSVFAVRDKSGAPTGDSYFVLKGHNNESVKFVVSKNGVMKSAVYQDWAHPANDNGAPTEKFCAKNLDELRSVARDEGLVEMAQLFDWGKGAEAEAEEEAEIEME